MTFLPSDSPLAPDYACCQIDGDGMLAVLTSQGVYLERLGAETAQEVTRPDQWV